ncbi:hypothetical protein ACF8C4_14080 [Myroides odoratimimus]|uniref:hypothetical protein n=1 Tax=Myroides odoratimimus TaxID=76832 RepID=UPI00370ABAF5
MSKIDQINNLLNELKPLNEERLFLELQYNNDKAKFMKNPEKPIQIALEEAETRLKKLYSLIVPLQNQLRNLQTKYFVEYEGELTNIYNNNSKYWNLCSEELYFKNECDINTFENAISNINDTYNLEALLLEISNFIYYHRFTNHKIINIKKIN